MPRTQPMTSLARRLAALACPLALAVGCSGDDGPTTASETDGGTDTDSAAPPCVAELAPGALVITEIMANPTGPDAELEWIELHNPGDQTISLDGVRLVASKVNGDSPDEHSITGLELAPGDYVTLGNLLDPEKFVFVDYAYGDALGDLINSAGVVRVMCGDVEVDAVVYESEKDGASYTFNGALAPDATANDDSGEWCRATSLIENFQTGDLGTPGEPNGYCPPPAGQCYEGATLRPIAAPGYGDLVISEFMANPDAVTDADSGGIAMPIPTPARARAPMITTAVDDSPRVAIHPMAATTPTAPPVAAHRAPTRRETTAARGPAMEKAKGRAMLTRPVRVSL